MKTKKTISLIICFIFFIFCKKILAQEQELTFVSEVLNLKKIKKTNESTSTNSYPSRISKPKKIEIFTSLRFQTDMEGFLWINDKEYPVYPNQPTDEIELPQNFDYYFVTENKKFRTTKINDKRFPDQKEEKETIYLSLQKKYHQFIKEQEELKQSKAIFDKINHNFIPIERNVILSKYEVTVEQFAQFIYETGGKRSKETIDSSFIIQHLESIHHIRTNKQGVDWSFDPLGKKIENPSTCNHPVVNVSWYEAQQFCEWLSQKESNYIYRLPTRQEWEKAAVNLEEKTIAANIPDTSILKVLPNKKVIFRNDDSYPLTSPVGVFPANSKGFYDMIGNVAEWLDDDLQHPMLKEHRKIIKGGSYFMTPKKNTIKNNPGLAPYKRHSGVGFRICRIKK